MRPAVRGEKARALSPQKECERDARKSAAPEYAAIDGAGLSPLTRHGHFEAPSKPKACRSQARSSNALVTGADRPLLQNVKPSAPVAPRALVVVMGRCGGRQGTGTAGAIEATARIRATAVAAMAMMIEPGREGEAWPTVCV
eukprot:6175868-Pleurochrysis_carterae.AAC.8